MRSLAALALAAALIRPAVGQAVGQARLDPARTIAVPSLSAAWPQGTAMAVMTLPEGIGPGAPGAADSFAKAQALAPAVASPFTPDLLKPQRRKQDKPAPYGHCYAACEALLHMAGGKAAAEVHPERTAMPRSGPSVPARLAAPLMKGEVLDYGAGRGADTRFLRKKGLRVDSYDPYFAPEKPAIGKRYDWIMLNYVLNVIASPAQRGGVLSEVAARLKPGGRVLVAVRGASELEVGRGPRWKRRGDGWLTPRGTFQHGYTPEELKAALAARGLEIERTLAPLAVVARKAGGSAPRFGKETPAAVYFHKSWEDGAPPRLRDLVERARTLLPKDARWNVVKVAHDGKTVSVLWYPDFDSDPHPALRYVYRVDLKSRTLKEDDHRGRANPFILHRKDSFVSPQDPRYAAFRRVTEKEEAAGLLNRNDIGTRDGWAKALRASRRRSS